MADAVIGGLNEKKIKYITDPFRQSLKARKATRKETMSPPGHLSTTDPGQSTAPASFKES